MYRFISPVFLLKRTLPTFILATGGLKGSSLTYMFGSPLITQCDTVYEIINQLTIREADVESN